MGQAVCFYRKFLLCPWAGGVKLSETSPSHVSDWHRSLAPLPTFTHRVRNFFVPGGKNLASQLLPRPLVPPSQDLFFLPLCLAVRPVPAHEALCSCRLRRRSRRRPPAWSPLCTR